MRARLVIPVVLLALLALTPPATAQDGQSQLIGTQWMSERAVHSFRAGEYFGDPDGNQYTYGATAEPAEVVVATPIPESDTIVFAARGLGSGQVTVTATDGAGRIEQVSFRVAVVDFKFSLDTETIAEGAGPRTITATVTLAGAAPEEDLEIETTVYHRNATPADYWMYRWSDFVLPAGQMSHQIPVRFRPIPDVFWEEDEPLTFAVRAVLESEIGGTGFSISLGGHDTVTILDVPPPSAGVVTGTAPRAPRNVRWQAQPDHLLLRWDPPLVGATTGYLLTATALDDQGETLPHRSPEPDARLGADALGYRLGDLWPGQACEVRLQSLGNNNRIPSVIVLRTPLHAAEGPGPHDLRIDQSGRILWQFDLWRAIHPNFLFLFRWTWGDSPPEEIPSPEERWYGNAWASEANCTNEGECSLYLHPWDPEAHYLLQMRIEHGFTDDDWRTIRWDPSAIH